MGCLNDSDEWKHWFANIHLSGPCNRRCYFCIGQHMMALDSLNSLDTPPSEMSGMGKFIEEVNLRGIKEIDLTGTNTDPCLYRHHVALVDFLRESVPGAILGIRTNGSAHVHEIGLYDKGSITICSTDYATNLEMMGGPPPDLGELAFHADLSKFKINCVLGPRNANKANVLGLVSLANKYGMTRLNLREPYGQAHVGYFFMDEPEGEILQGTVPIWTVDGVSVAYWDVHTVGVRSVNLYANGRVSMDYPVTRGHVENGIVRPQKEFEGHARRTKQWVRT